MAKQKKQAPREHSVDLNEALGEDRERIEMAFDEHMGEFAREYDLGNIVLCEMVRLYLNDLEGIVEGELAEQDGLGAAVRKVVQSALEVK